MSILLVHGVGGRPRSWNGVLAQLDPTLRSETVAVDVIVGAGQSLAEVAHRLLDDHPGSHVIVGHSFGGMLAQEAALIDHSRVRGLLLVSSIPGATPRVAGINEALAAAIDDRGLETVAVEFAAGLFAPGRLARNPELGDAFVADMLDAGASLAKCVQQPYFRRLASRSERPIVVDARQVSRTVSGSTRPA